MKFSSAQQATFERFVDLFFDENKKANITGCEDREVFWRKHVIDSAMLEKFVTFRPGQRVVDIGTGGGLPGFVLAVLYPETKFVLVDSHRKKTQACENIAAELGLGNVTIRCVRAEDMGRDPEFREQFDWAVTRAVAKLPVLLEYSLPLIVPGGWFAAYKGQNTEQEIADSRWPLKALGGRMEGSREFELPGGDDHRSLVFVEKIAKVTRQFPRRNGVPRRRPISEADAKSAIESRMEEVYSEQQSRENDPGHGGGRPSDRGRGGGASRGGTDGRKMPSSNRGGDNRSGASGGARRSTRDTRGGGSRRGSSGPATVS